MKNLSVKNHTTAAALVSTLAGIAATSSQQIADTEDLAEKEQAFDEWIAGGLKALHPHELKVGDKIRSAQRTFLDVTEVKLEEECATVFCGELYMTIPKNGIVLIKPEPDKTDADA